jgi:hypothetical protein
MMVDPGVVYAGGEAVIGPITAFVQRLKLPEAANSRYRVIR